MDIVEKVARAIDSYQYKCEETAQRFVASAGNRWEGSFEQRVHNKKRAAVEESARAAIRATLEHYRDNVSDDVVFRGAYQMAGELFVESDMVCARECFRAMTDQALKELDRSEGLTGS